MPTNPFGDNPYQSPEPIVQAELVKPKSNKATIREAWPVLVIAFIAAAISAGLAFYVFTSRH